MPSMMISGAQISCGDYCKGDVMNVFKPTMSDFRKRLGLEGKYIILGPASKWLAPVNKTVLEENYRKDESFRECLQNEGSEWLYTLFILYRETVYTI